MPGKSLTPQEIEYKKIISSRLNDLLSKSGKRKSDITQQTGLPASTLTGYFGGKRLPSEKSVAKLASFFDVDESYIDPRLNPKSIFDSGNINITGSSQNSGTIITNSDNSGNHRVSNAIARKTRDNSTEDLALQKEILQILKEQNAYLADLINQVSEIKELFKKGN